MICRLIDPICAWSEGERHKSLLGRHLCTLKNRPIGLHRANGYVKYMAQPYWADQSHDPNEWKEEQGEPDAAYKQAVAA